MKKIWVHKATSFQDAEQFDIRFWKHAGAGARFIAVWLMVIEFLKIRGKKSVVSQDYEELFKTFNA